jgi:N-acetylneuraminic acid mutarotase
MRRSLLLCCVLSGTVACSTANHVATQTPVPHAPAGPRQLVVEVAPWRLTARRSRAVALASGDRVLVLSGLANGSSTSSVLSIDPSAGSVTHAGALSEPVHDAAGALLDGTAYVFGGGRVGSTDAVQTYAAGKASTAGHLPRPRSDLAADVIGGRAYIAGGFDGSRLTPAILSTTDGTRFTVAGTLALGVRYPAVASIGNSLWIVGGSTATTESSATGQVDLIQRFDTGNGRTVVAGHLPHSLAHASAFVVSGSLYVAGGVDGRRPLDDVWRIDMWTGAVTRAGRLPGPRSDAAVAVLHDTAWLLGGENGGPSAPLDTVVSVRLL